MDDSGWNQSAASRGAEKWGGSGCILMVAPMKLADRLVEEREKTRMSLKILTQAIGRVELPLGKIM